MGSRSWFPLSPEILLTPDESCDPYRGLPRQPSPDADPETPDYPQLVPTPVDQNCILPKLYRVEQFGVSLQAHQPPSLKSEGGEEVALSEHLTDRRSGWGRGLTSRGLYRSSAGGNGDSPTLGCCNLWGLYRSHRLHWATGLISPMSLLQSAFPLSNDDGKRRLSRLLRGCRP